MWKKISYTDFIFETRKLEKTMDTAQETGPDPRRIVEFSTEGIISHYLETDKDGISTYFMWVE